MVSIARDNYFVNPTKNIGSIHELTQYLNRLNANFVNAMKMVSLTLLIQLMEMTGRHYNAQIASLDLLGPALFGVSWAGEDRSMNWFHIARVYTERWHHQQQIRDAVGKPGILTKELYHPVLDTFMMALPYTYRHLEAVESTVIQVTITGEGGGNWFLEKKKNGNCVKRITGRRQRTPLYPVILLGNFLQKAGERKRWPKKCRLRRLPHWENRYWIWCL